MEVWQDEETGLYWQVVAPAILFDELTIKEANERVEAFNNQRYGGFDDWRMPTVGELLSLAPIKLFDYRAGTTPREEYARWREWVDENESERRLGYFIKEELAGNMGPEGWYWSGEIAENGEYWLVNFKDGNTNTNVPTQSYYVRLVRG
ncbi:MAG: DUF1566 domain-containing protein [Campylobacterales bacterium]